ncbi:Protein ASI3 [Leucoagaricus sp. SymC.cos]|nr:Protein ASI3 [Leucoagaricus sp. SymC.cos]
MDDLPSLHNISFALNFTAFFDFLPNKLLSRLVYKFKHKVASPTELDLGTIPPPTLSDLLATTDDWHSALPLVTKTPTSGGKAKLGGQSVDERSLLLGPLGFFTSGYMLVLFLMAFVLHRLHHTVIPSRLAGRGLLRRGPRYPGRAIVFIRFYRSIFPIDLSRTHTRFMLQFPTLYCLLRMCLLWGLTILQTSGTYPETFPSWVPGWTVNMVQKLGNWASHKAMDEICWISFCSLSVAYFVESFIRKLDELANGTVEEVHLGRQMSPYNLVCAYFSSTRSTYADWTPEKVAHSFVLYLFSLSTSHVHKPDGLPARPDIHALITMGIPLLQSTLFHILCISKKYSNHRLIPTAFTSLLGLLHFHITLIIRGYPAVFLPLITSDGAKDPAENNVFSGTGFRSSYPLMNYFSCVIETALISVIIFTVFLNAVVQVLVNGQVVRVFTTLGIAASGSITDNPDTDSARFSWSNLPFEEEWGVVLMRIGTASLEATGLKGWGNEVAPITAPIRVSRRGLRRRGRNTLPSPSLEPLITYGTVRMGRSGRHVTGSVVQLRGWNNEVRLVDTNASGGSTRRRNERRWTWFREFVKFTKSFSGVLLGLLRIVWAWACRWRGQKGYEGSDAETEERSRRRRRARGPAFENRTLNGTDLTMPTEAEKKQSERELYERFLRGEDISDDEDDPASDEYDPNNDSDIYREEEERKEEVIALFTDLVRSQGVDEGSRLVCGHLAHVSGRRQGVVGPPLTRRRWRQIGKTWGLGFVDDEDDAVNVGLSTSVDSWNVYGREEGEEGGGEWSEVDWTERLTCIICTSRPREIVSWPCRCLVMCDQCREILAARGSPGKHGCPCCRQPIDGYSRIFIP